MGPSRSAASPGHPYHPATHSWLDSIDWPRSKKWHNWVPRWGRTFSYRLLKAVTPLDDAALLQSTALQLVAAELLYQRGAPPQVTYLFKHALIQEAAYQSLLKSTRQQSHQRIAQVLETRFPETLEPNPNCWRTTIPRRASTRRRSYTGSRLASVRSSARRMWKR